jgi:hypothetical protein
VLLPADFCSVTVGAARAALAASKAAIKAMGRLKRIRPFEERLFKVYQPGALSAEKWQKIAVLLSHYKAFDFY